MRVPRNSDRSQTSSQHHEDGTQTVRLIAFGGIIVCVLTAAFVYLRMSQSMAEPHLEEQNVDIVDVAPADPFDRWHLSEFVGSEKCSECHSEIAETYARHPMASTLALVADASPIEVIENDSPGFEALGCRYRVERDGDRMIHSEFMTDADGKLVFDQSEEVHYAVGSGMNARTYLIDRGGLLFESPITWFVDEQEWDLSPGYEDNPRQRFNRRVADGCVQCHSGRVAPAGDGTSNRFKDHPFPELGIGCERCHGPGRRHVEKFESADWDADASDAEDTLIVNPASLDSHLAEDVCYQCHMNGKRRILRKGKSYHDFQPGMATEDIWTVFVSPTRIGSESTNPFSTHTEQMHASACFLGSEGSMSCTTCHDPHSVPAADEQAEFYRQRCNSCHSDQGCSLPLAEREHPPSLNSCIDCHMPSSGSRDIPHASHSDHRVLRDPANHPVTAESHTSGEIWTIFDDSEERLPEWELQRSRALALSDQSVEEMDQRLVRKAVAALEAVLAHDPNDVEVLRSLAFLYGLGQNHQKAISYFEAALKVDPQDELSLKNLGLMASRVGALRKGLNSYDAYLKLNKWDPTMFAPYVFMLAATGKVQEAVKAAEYGLRLDPTDRELRRLASELYAKLGDQTKSANHLKILKEISTQLDPWDQQRQERLKEELRQKQQP
ncbi:MAG: hypothetical protein KDA52_03315 [Planctomycetaceae bacterium]|nr:hypothetical protein [Planctomycetaceae bacterium]